MKKQIKLEEIAKEQGMSHDLAAFIASNRVMQFFDFIKLRELQDHCREDYVPAELKIGDKKMAIVMKNSLSDALTDPNAGHADALKEAGEVISGVLRGAYEKKTLKPLESVFERTIYERYVSSLIMNLVNYPLDTPNENTLEILGLKDKNISKLYISAAAAWLGSSEGLESVLKSRIIEKIENIGYKGKSDVVNLGTENCHSGSHYILNAKLNKNQIKIQAEAPVVPHSYTVFEGQIVNHIQKIDHGTIGNNATNLVRLYLNMSLLYDRNKPLPLEWK